MAIDYLSTGFSIERNEILSIMQPKRKDRIIISETEQNIDDLMRLYGRPVFNECGDPLYEDASLVPLTSTIMSVPDTATVSDTLLNPASNYKFISDSVTTPRTYANLNALDDAEVVTGGVTTEVIIIGTGVDVATFVPLYAIAAGTTVADIAPTMTGGALTVPDETSFEAQRAVSPFKASSVKMASETVILRDTDGNPVYKTYSAGACSGAYMYTGTKQKMSVDELKYKPRTEIKLSTPCDTALGIPRVYVNGFELESKSYIRGALFSVNVKNAGTGFSPSSRIDYVDLKEQGTGYPNDVKVLVVPHVLDTSNGTITQELKLEATVISGAIVEVTVVQPGIGYFYKPTIQIVDALTDAVVEPGVLKVSKGGATTATRYGVSPTSGYSLLPDGITSRLAGTISSPTTKAFIEIGSSIFEAINDGAGFWYYDSTSLTSLMNSGSVPYTVYAQSGDGKKSYNHNLAGIPLPSIIEPVVNEMSVPYFWEVSAADRNTADVSLPLLKIKTGTSTTNGVNGGILDIEIIDRGYGFKKPLKLIVKDPVTLDEPSSRVGYSFSAPVIETSMFDIPRDENATGKFFYNKASNSIVFDDADGLRSLRNPLSSTGYGIRKHDEIVIEYFVDSDESKKYMDIDGLLRQLATDLTTNPYDSSAPQPFHLVYPMFPNVDAATGKQDALELEASIDLITTSFVVESDKGADFLSSSLNINPNSDFMPANPMMTTRSMRQPQKWRIKFEWDEQIEAMRVYVGTKYQIKDDGTVSKPRGREGSKSSITRLPGELCEIYYSDTSTASDRGSSTKSKSPFFLRTTRNMIEQYGTYPLTYRLTVTDHGIAFHIMEQADLDSDLNHAWFVIQRHVDNRSGKWEMEDGYSPVHCLYSPSKIDAKYRSAQLFEEFKWYDMQQTAVGTTTASGSNLSFTDSTYAPTEKYVARNVTSLIDSGGSTKLTETPVVIKYTYAPDSGYTFASERSSSATVLTATFGGNLNSTRKEAYMNGPYAYSLLKVPSVVGYTQNSSSLYSVGGSFDAGSLPNIPNVGKYIRSYKFINNFLQTIKNGLETDSAKAAKLLASFKSLRDDMRQQGSSYKLPNSAWVSSSGEMSFASLDNFSDYVDTFKKTAKQARPGYGSGDSAGITTAINSMTPGEYAIWVSISANGTYETAGYRAVKSVTYVFAIPMSLDEFSQWRSGSSNITCQWAVPPYGKEPTTTDIPFSMVSSVSGDITSVTYGLYYKPFAVAATSTSPANTLFQTPLTTAVSATTTAISAAGSDTWTMEYAKGSEMPMIKPVNYGTASGNLVNIARKTRSFGSTTSPTVVNYVAYSPSVTINGAIGNILKYSPSTDTTSVSFAGTVYAAESSLPANVYNQVLANVENNIVTLEDFVIQANKTIDFAKADLETLKSMVFDASAYTLFDISGIEETTTFTAADQISDIVSTLQNTYGQTNGEYSGLEKSDITDILPPRPDNITYFEVYVNGAQIKPASESEYEEASSVDLGTRITWLPAKDPGVQQFVLDYVNDRVWLRYPTLVGDTVTIKYYVRNDSVSNEQTVLIKRVYDQEFPQMEDINETKAIYRFIVREKDILTPTPIHKLATIHQVDSFAVINPLEQISITSDRTYVYMFPGPLTTNRFLYPNSELDLMCYSSAENSAHTSLIRVGTETNLKYDHDAIEFDEVGSISQTKMNYRDEYKYPADFHDATRAGKNWNLDANGKKVPRLYQGMMSTLPNGNGMRIFLLAKYGPIRPDFSDIVESEYTVLN